jgi:lipopolysaccharide biosynthesis glycosyltransferase
MNEICMSFDDAYVLPALITLKSLKINTQNKFKVTIINMNSTLSSPFEKIVSNWCKKNDIEISLIPVMVDSSQFHVDKRITIAAYGRIFAIAILEKPFIYFDSDILAQKNWDSIFRELDSLVLENGYLLATLGSNAASSSSRNVARKLAGDSYFESGVLGVNANLVNSIDFKSKVLSLNKQYEKNHFWAHDQDILNFIFHGEAKVLSSIYNSNIWKKHDSAPRILHFGFFKPWKISGVAFFSTLLIAVVYDFLDVFRRGVKVSRSKRLLEHKRFERLVRSEVRKISEKDDFMDNHDLNNFKKITLIEMIRYLFKIVTVL